MSFLRRERVLSLAVRVKEKMPRINCAVAVLGCCNVKLSVERHFLEAFNESAYLCAVPGFTSALPRADRSGRGQTAGWGGDMSCVQALQHHACKRFSTMRADTSAPCVQALLHHACGGSRTMLPKPNDGSEGESSPSAVPA